MAVGEWHHKPKFWSDLDRRIKVLVILLLVIGLVMFTFGLWRDATGSWTNWPFMVNMIASVTSACFGIPIAVVVLRALLSRQQERTEKLRAHRLAAVSSKELNERVWDFVQDEKALRRSVVELKRNCEALGELLYILSPQSGNPPPERGQVETRLAKLEANVSASESDASLGLISADQAVRITEDVRSKWEYIHTFVRPQLLGAGSEWLSDRPLDLSKTVKWAPFAEARLERFLAGDLKRVLGEYQRGTLQISELRSGLNEIYSGLSKKLACVEAVNDLTVFAGELDHFMATKRPM